MPSFPSLPHRWPHSAFIASSSFRAKSSHSAAFLVYICSDSPSALQSIKSDCGRPDRDYSRRSVEDLKKTTCPAYAGFATAFDALHCLFVAIRAHQPDCIRKTPAVRPHSAAAAGASLLVSVCSVPGVDARAACQSFNPDRIRAPIRPAPGAPTPASNTPVHPLP